MATGGMGSQLVIRAREAAQRAKAAESLGLTGPSKLVQGQSNPMQGPVVTAQPIQPASLDVPMRDRALGTIEEFLRNLGTSGASGPTGLSGRGS